MLRTVILVLFPMFWRSSEGIQCYLCIPEQVSGYEPLPLCQYFDYSAKYIADCPHSSMCYKKVVHLDMPNGLSTSSVQKGCAAQTLEGEQEKTNGTWHYVYNVHEVYEAGCSESARDGLATNTLHCYCRGSLCNGGPTLRLSTTILLAINFLVNSFS